jgi:signal transduction histidine kinase
MATRERYPRAVRAGGVQTTGPSWARPVGAVASVAVVVVGLLATWATARSESDRAARELDVRTSLVARDVQDQLQALLDEEVATALATTSLLRATPELDRAAFARFASGLLAERPSLLGLGYIHRVPAADLPGFVAEARADGAPDFPDVEPTGVEAAVILYNEPAEELRGSWGTDLRSIAEAAEGLDRAVAEGGTVITARLVLAVDRDRPVEEQPASYVLYAPVLRPGAPDATAAERRAALLGWTNVPFRAQDILEQVRLPDGIAVSLRDGAPGGPVAVAGPTTGASAPDGERSISVPGATWTLELRTSPAFSDEVVDRTAWAVATGAALTTLLAVLVGLLATGSRRWSRLATRATADLEARAAELERSNRDLEEFATVASHDLSEPLRVVGGYVDLVRHRYGAGQPLDDRGVHYLQQAGDAVERMRELIEGLLEYSRLRSDAVRFGEVDLDRVAADAVANLRPAIDEAGATVDVRPLPTVWGDQTLLVQVLQNLLANAVRFRDPERPCRVVVEARPGDPAADGLASRWAISVTDDGIGIDPAHQERIFAMFRRLHGPDRHPGTGIGLAVCRRVVDLHGGEITVSSAPGAGASFTFTVPGVRERQALLRRPLVGARA